jgi:hypothetical protein
VARHRFGWAFLWSFGSFPLRLPDAKAQSKTRKRNAKRRRAAAVHRTLVMRFGYTVMPESKCCVFPVWRIGLQGGILVRKFV